MPLTFVQSVSGMLTNLPCNITPSVPGDKVNLVLWYKDGLGKPLYSFDLRGDIADPDGKIWASAEIGGGVEAPPGAAAAAVERDSYRAQLHTKSEPTAVLSLLGVTEGDAGSYRCRVDFKRSPTRYWKVVLQVIGERAGSRFNTAQLVAFTQNLMPIGLFLRLAASRPLKAGNAMRQGRNAHSYAIAVARNRMLFRVGLVRRGRRSGNLI